MKVLIAIAILLFILTCVAWLLCYASGRADRETRRMYDDYIDRNAGDSGGVDCDDNP